jgi:hypothetical protein
MIRSVNVIIMGPLPHLLCHEVSSLIRSNAIWNTMAVSKAFCQSTDGSFDRRTACRKKNPYPEGVSIPERIKHCPFHNGSSPMYSTYHQETCWWSWGIVNIRDSMLEASAGWLSTQQWKSMLLRHVYLSFLPIWPLYSWAHWMTASVAGADQYP